MNLLPKSHEKFSEVNYWDKFFKKRGQKAFEWYGEYPELCGYLFKYVKHKDDVLVVGCGNSTLSMDLYDIGYKNIINIDISQVAIKQMQTLNKTTRPDLIYENMDATQMTFPDESYNVVLDKGTLDALMSDTSESTISNVDKYFGEINRVLRNGGRYICISLLQEHILQKIVSDISAAGFMIRIVKCHEAELKAKDEDGSSLPVFIVVATKFKKLPQPIFEVALAEGHQPTRVSTKEELISAIKSAQESALICHGLYKGNIADIGEVSLDLYQPNDKNPRFTIFILDKPPCKKSTRTYAVFIVPQGRENDWLFSTKEGRQQLLESTKRDRLMIVTLRREHKFENLGAVQEELSNSIRNFAPAELARVEIPFLTLGNDLGKRTTCYEGESEMSGPFIVEETEDDCCIHRRIVFLNNLFVTQSESRLKMAKSRRGKPKKVIDYGYLSCFHHVYMAVGVNAAIQENPSGHALVIGLGGGALCSFLQHSFPQLKVTAVDIDKAMLQVAKEYFGLNPDERLEVTIADGIKYLEDSSKSAKKFNAIMFDVDNKDTSVGMSCPPKQFLEASTLRWVVDCLTEDGLFLLNLVIRNKTLRPDILKDLKKHFKFIVSFLIPHDVNEIIMCSEKMFDEKMLKNAARNLNEHVKARNLLESEIVNVDSLISALKIED